MIRKLLPDLKLLIALAGAAIVIAWSMIEGLRLHRLVEKHAPRLAALIPCDGGAVAGLVVGIAIVLTWVI